MTPDVRVLRGEPDDVELAALLAGLAAGAAAHHGHPVTDEEMSEAAIRAAVARRRWREGARRLADPLAPGPDAWRWSAQG